MTFSYYPGCTLKTKAKDLDRYARSAAAALGVEMAELPEWQCCGAVYPQAKDEIATKLSAVRALMAARDEGRELLTLCSACHHVIKRVNHDMVSDENIRTKVNNYLKPEVPYTGETKVIHYLEMLRDTVGFDELAKRVTRPLKGRRIAAYYGCMLLRPGNVMGFDDPENPRIMEDFIRAIGAEPVVIAYRNECCGGYMTLENRALAQKKATTVVDAAASAGADTIVTACPLCQYNLDVNAVGERVPVLYFTELLAEALGVKEAEA
ncbi:MAG: CoB--CoM heterodisulfide reductase iron-sulfur subunit B family protein [Eubacteriales bacterium]|nr:CoB--CoM heterodisulfide reductase iron-sulfur subunit B family protein [Eubacteriales bacterium]